MMAAQWKEVPERTFAAFLRKQRALHTVFSVDNVDIRGFRTRVFFIGAEHYSDPKATWIAKMETIGNTALFHITEP